MPEQKRVGTVKVGRAFHVDEPSEQSQEGRQFHDSHSGNKVRFCLLNLFAHFTNIL